MDYYALQLYANKGVMLNGGSRRRGLPACAGGIKSNISGWSAKSRRTMREFLLQNTFPEGWKCVGGSFTVPGEDIEAVTPRFKELIRQFGQYIQRKMGGGMVWRLELQVRKMPHLHSLLIFPDVPGGWEFQGKIFPLSEVLKWVWFYYIDSVLPALPCPVIDGVPAYLIENTEIWESKYKGWYRISTMGATAYNWLPEWARHCSSWSWKYAVNIQDGGGRASWLRYLQDHATKSKQEQIPEKMGRHWGVVGRSFFRPVDSVQEYLLTEKQYAHIIRQGGRLACPRVKDVDSLFGRRLGYKPHRGRIGCGQAVVFSSTDTYVRIIEEARRLYPERVPGSIFRIVRALRWGVLLRGHVLTVNDK